MQSSTLQMLDLFNHYSYWVLFPLVVIEGPGTMMLAGFFVSIGYMAFIPVYITIVIADLVGDVLYYLAGRFFLNSGVIKFLNFLSVDIKKIKKAEEVMKRNKGKILFFGKLSHAIGGPILVAAGVLKVSVRDFVWYNFLATLPKSLAFLLVGYFFGHAFGKINKYLSWTTAILAVVTALVVFLYWIVFKKAKKIVGDI